MLLTSLRWELMMSYIEENPNSISAQTPLQSLENMFSFVKTSEEQVLRLRRAWLDFGGQVSASSQTRLPRQTRR